MNTQDAEKINKGDIVTYGGEQCRVENVTVRGMAAPYFRLSSVETGEAKDGGQQISYKLVSRT